MSRIVFWQTIVSPHMLGLADALIGRGHSVLYATASKRCETRSATGWPEDVESACEIRIVPDRAAAAELVQREPADAVHLFQGMRSHGVLSAAFPAAVARTPRVWCMLERVDERDWLKACIRSFVYRRLLRRHAKHDIRILAIGKGMREWLIHHGGRPERIYPFAYFLSPHTAAGISKPSLRVRLAFVGRLIPLKRVDLLLQSLENIDPGKYDLTIIGDGPLRHRLMRKAHELGNECSITWSGTKPMGEVRDLMPTFDCVILPSDHDGWGAVVSEALIAGTPVICSDRCGAAEAITTPDMGAVFRHGDVGHLHQHLVTAVTMGPVTSALRRQVQQCAQSLTAEAGAEYLDSLLAAVVAGGAVPQAPWYRNSITFSEPLRP